MQLGNYVVVYMSNKKNRQQWLLNKARGQQCTAMIDGVCNHDTSTTVAAHIQLPAQGIMGAKTHDLHVAWVCSACHDAIDRRTNTDLERDFVRYKAYEAVLRTQLRLFALLTPQEKQKLGEGL